MVDEKNHVSIVLCAYTLDRWEDLLGVVQSLQAQTVQPSEIILVIDHNPTLFSRAQETFPALKVVENHEERGLSGARNSGITHSTGQIIAFIDEDAVAEPMWIEHLLRDYQDDPQVIGVGGEVSPLWSTTQPDWFPEEFNWVVGCSYKGLPKVTTPVRNPIGCNMSFRREVLLAAGGFRNGVGRIGTLPVGCEETELTIRARQLRPGAVYLYEPQAVVYHKVPEWRMSWRYFAHRCYAEGLSKALVTHFVGSADGLSSERYYVINTLPNGVVGGLRETIVRREIKGLKRTVAIVVGLCITGIGYIAGLAKRLRRTHSPSITGFDVKSQQPR